MLPSERGPLGRRGRARDRVRPVEHQVEDLVKHLDHEDLVQERGAVGATLPAAEIPRYCCQPTDRAVDDSAQQRSMSSPAG